MSTAPLLRSTSMPVDQSAFPLDLAASDQKVLELANKDDSVVNRTGGARGVLAGVTVGALLWAGLIWAGAMLIK